MADEIIAALERYIAAKILKQPKISTQSNQSLLSSRLERMHFDEQLEVGKQP